MINKMYKILIQAGGERHQRLSEGWLNVQRLTPLAGVLLHF